MHSDTSMDTPDTLPRGVYRLPCLSAGRTPVLLAVTSRGVCLDVRWVGVGEDERAVVAVLRRMLDQVDPQD